MDHIKELAKTHRTADLNKSNFLLLQGSKFKLQIYCTVINVAHIKSENKGNVVFLLIEVKKAECPTYVNV